MLQSDRRVAILKLLQENHTVAVSQLCEALKVSEMTIRRDLREMDSDGLLRRVHGGAIKIVRHSYEPPYLLRQSENHEIKQKIGCSAARLISNGDSIALDVGTTTLEIARALDSLRELTIL